MQTSFHMYCASMVTERMMTILTVTSVSASTHCM